MTNLNPYASAMGLNAKPADFLEVLSKLAHMLSQPLTSLRGSVEIALMSQLNEPESRRLLELSLQESNRMAEVLGALRDVLAMEASSGEIQTLSWTRIVKKSLEAGDPIDEVHRTRLATDLKGEVWVKANPYCLEVATARLVQGAIKAVHHKQVVQVELSIVDEAACLSVCNEGEFPDSMARTIQSYVRPSPDVLGLGDPSWLIVRRAIERQGGWLDINRPSETVCCCRIHLPLAPLDAIGKNRTITGREF